MQISNYEYSQKIGQGAFGIVYKGKNRRTNEPVVVKTEPYDVEFSSLKHESTILNILYSKSCRSIPPTYWYGVEPLTRQRILVMPFYDESLESYVLKRAQNGVIVLDIRIAQNIMRSCISVLNHIHNRFVVHRDIKPANWMIRRDEIVLIDFGLATFYVDESETHIPPASQPKTHLIGTPKYVSWNVHCGEEYTRRDDLISMVYVGLFMLRGPNFMHQPQSCDILHQQTTPEPSKTDCSHPLNQFYKKQKILENIKHIIAESWPALKSMADATYGLAFQERPSYDNYTEWFSS